MEKRLWRGLMLSSLSIFLASPRKFLIHPWELINDIPGVSCVKPNGALYMFPKIDAKRFNIHDDQKMVLDFLLQEKVLLVQGTAFNWPWPDHVRIVTLPREDDLEMAISRFGRFLSGYHQ